MSKFSFIFLLFYLFSFNLFSEEFEEYVVQDKDNLSKIAKEKLSHPSKWKELLKYNNIDNPNLIKKGLVLKIPNYLGKPKAIPQKIEVIGKLKLFKGDVRYKRGESDWLQTDRGLDFWNGDFVRTMEKSSAEIFFFETPSTTLKIQESTILKLEKKDTKSIDLKYGEVFLKTVPNNTGEIKFRVQTPSSTAGVKGTEFYVNVDKLESSIYGCYLGKIEVTAQKVTVTVPEGYGTKVIKGQPPMEPFKLLEKVITKPGQNE